MWSWQRAQPQGQAHPHGAGGRHAVDAVLGEELVDDDAALAVQAVVAVERGRDALLEGRAGQHVARELLDREPVERHVGVVGVDDPVAPAPHRPLAVGLVAVGVGVAGGVEPLHGHALAVARRREQPVDGLLVGVGGVVVQEVGELDRGRGHAGEVEGDAAQQGRAVGLVGRGQALGLEPPQHEAVDVVAGPLGVGDGRHDRPLGRDERPVRLPLRALVYPQAEGLDLRLVEGLAAAGHPHPRVVGRDAVHEEARRRVSGDDGGAAVAAAVGERTLGHVEPQAGLPRRLVGPVAREAVLREQGPHLAGEVDGAPGHRGRSRARRRGVGAEVRALVDPRPHELDLAGRERPPRRGRGHEADGLVRRQPLEQRAALGVAGPHVGLDEVGGVEPQLGLPGRLGRAVAREAGLGEHRPHVAVELDPLRRLGEDHLRTAVREEPRRHRRRPSTVNTRRKVIRIASPGRDGRLSAPVAQPCPANRHPQASPVRGGASSGRGNHQPHQAEQDGGPSSEQGAGERDVTPGLAVDGLLDLANGLVDIGLGLVDPGNGLVDFVLERGRLATAVGQGLVWISSGQGLSAVVCRCSSSLSAVICRLPSVPCGSRP